MDLAVELIAAIVVGLLVFVVGGVALLRGRGTGADVGVDEQTAAELREPQPQPPPPIPVAPEDLDGVEAPLATDLEDPRLAAPPAEAEAELAEAPEAPADLRLEPAPAPLTARERFRLRLGRARGTFGASVAGIFGRGITEEAWEDLEESLIAADVGVEATMELVEGLRGRVRAEGVTTGDGALALLKEVLRLELQVADRTLRRRSDGTTVWLVTGVNGTGKTTSIGKLAARHATAGETVVLAAGDTFRAAAAEQLELWGERSGSRVVRGQEGGDPASVAFDGWKAADAAGADLLLVDTAGRLQNKTALMNELTKVKRVLERDAGPCDEVLLVLDATTGQNGLIQAKIFRDVVQITGIVLTKLDGSAKGGIVVQVQRELGVPVKLVGLGEGVDDLAPFDPEVFVDALLDPS